MQKKPIKVQKKKKKKMKNYTDKPDKFKLTDKKTSKEISDFYEGDEEESNKKIKREFNPKILNSNTFRKGFKNNDKYYDTTYKSKKSYEFHMRFDKNREKKYKLQSSITLTKNPFSKKSSENTKEINVNKKLLKRRHTIFTIKDKPNNIFNTNSNKHNNIKSIHKNNSFKSHNDTINDDGYDEDCSSETESNEVKESKMKMKLDKITEDKLILNYKNKNETIEVLSDKENIDNYYEYLEICLETMHEINLKEVPKSKAKIDFKFPNDKKHKKIALFDLDETLVHCVGEINKDNIDNPEFSDSHKIKVLLPNKKEVTIGINIRPHLKELLDKIKDVYNIVIFTASHRSYSDAVLNYLDPEDQYFHYRLYRDSCVQYKKNDINFYVKDLDIFKDNYDLKDIIIIDNSILSFAYHFNNGIPVVPFYDSKQDSELPLLCFYLLSIASYKDLREANKEHIKLEFFLSQAKNEISFDEGTTVYDNMSVNDTKNDKSIINNIKLNITHNSPRSIIVHNTQKEYELKNEITLNETDKNDDNNKDTGNAHKSEKKLNYEIFESRNNVNRKKFNTVKLESIRLLDFFEKWKNAYLQLALKK